MNQAAKAKHDETMARLDNEKQKLKNAYALCKNIEVSERENAETRRVEINREYDERIVRIEANKEIELAEKKKQIKEIEATRDLEIKKVESRKEVIVTNAKIEYLKKRDMGWYSTMKIIGQIFCDAAVQNNQNLINQFFALIPVLNDQNHTHYIEELDKYREDKEKLEQKIDTTKGSIQRRAKLELLDLETEMRTFRDDYQKQKNKFINDFFISVKQLQENGQISISELAPMIQTTNQYLLAYDENNI